MNGIWIALGGGIGALARFALSGWVTTWAYAGFPWGTFAVNVSGSLLLGFLHGALPASPDTHRARAFLTTGLCGGFTTFSTFDFETFSLIDEGRFWLAGGYAGGSVVLCIAGIFAGLWLARARSLPATSAERPQ